MACTGCNDGCFDESVQLQMGPSGQDGDDGTDGLSAYEIAVAEGFVGDEAAWLLSLVGATGAGTDGTTVLEVDFTEYEIDQNTFAAVTKSFAIPADTWETVDDIVELEALFVSDNTSSGNYQVRLEVDSNLVSIIPILNDVYISQDINFIKLRVQLALSAAGTIIPISEAHTGIGIYVLNYNGSILTPSIYRGGAITGLTTSGIIPLDLTLVSSVTGKNIKMFYYKLISMKK